MTATSLTHFLAAATKATRTMPIVAVARVRTRRRACAETIRPSPGGACAEHLAHTEFLKARAVNETALFYCPTTPREHEHDAHQDPHLSPAGPSAGGTCH